MCTRFVTFLFAIKCSSFVFLPDANIYYTETLYRLHYSCRPDTSQSVVMEAILMKINLRIN